MEQEDLIGGQDPNTTLNQIFEPIKRFVNWVIEAINTLISHLFDWDWIRGIFIGFFDVIDGWVERITGNDLASVFRIIGNTLADIFYFIVDLLKNLWPF